MLANLQRLLVTTLMAVACGWWLFFHLRAPLLAAAGVLLLVLGYTVLLAAEFVLVRVVHDTDASPPPTCPELFSAWVGEVLVVPQVFFWRQPFRVNAVPDNLSPQEGVRGRRGVVLVHGLFCNRGFWTPWLKRLQGRGHAFVAVNLEPVLCPIDDYVPQIEAAVARVTEATGMAPLLVCHSMGGLVARAWLKAMAAEARVHHVVTIGTPHRGTWMARFGQGRSAMQMRLQSEWLAQLEGGVPAGREGLFTCWYSSADNIVFPASTATLAGADNRLLRGVAHVQMAFLKEVMDTTLGLLTPDAV